MDRHSADAVIAKSNDAITSIFSKSSPSHLPTPSIVTSALPDVSLHYTTGHRCSPALLSSLLSRVATLRPMYDASAMPWDTTAKRDQLSSPAHHIISTSAPSAAHFAFLCLRFEREEEEGSDDEEEEVEVEEEDDDDDSNATYRVVTYVYELFVDEAWRGKGVATQLMRLAERLSRTVAVPELMLTVFDTNVAALHMYKNALS